MDDFATPKNLEISARMVAAVRKWQHALLIISDLPDQKGNVLATQKFHNYGRGPHEIISQVLRRAI